MATITFSLSRKTNQETGKNQILIRFVVGSRINQRAKSSLFVPSLYWDAEAQDVIVPKFRLMNAEQRELVNSLTAASTAVQGLKTAIMEAFIAAGAGKLPLPQGWRVEVVNKHENPEPQEAPAARLLSQAFEDFLSERHLSEIRSRCIRVVERAVGRYEAFLGASLEVDSITADTLRDFEEFQRNEAEIVEEKRELLELFPESRTPGLRSENTLINRMGMLRAVLNWEYKQGRTNNRPFDRFQLRAPVYGTPYYITIQERDRIYKMNLSRHPHLAIQRDIFVFQCLIGCRVSDLNKLTRENLVEGEIEYIPSKTIEARGAVVRVPLNSIAREIVEKYADPGRKALFPFISSQKYNDAIKRIFLAARLTRPVTILDPLTRKEVQRPLNEIASSHLARRTFVGNLYKQVKDPNLIAKLSGHTEGSKAFARYRDIDKEMRQELVKLLEQ